MKVAEKLKLAGTVKNNRDEIEELHKALSMVESENTILKTRFENLHKQQQRLRQRTPEDLIEKLINRTDKWILSNYKQLRSNSLMIIIGDHGRVKLDLEYSGKIAQWREASVPIAILIRK